jgi:endonuclease/exonuclease/phosphatase family metal-dependent hydrolase
MLVMILLLTGSLGWTASAGTPFADEPIAPAAALSTTASSGSAAPAEATSAGQRIRVGSYNIAHARGNKTGGLNELARLKNLRGIADLIKAQKLDIVGFQEISSHDLRAAFRDQTKYLAQRTGLTHHVYAENVEILGGLLATQGNAVISRFPIVSWVNHPLYRSDPKREPRSCLEVLLDLGQGRKLRLFVVHLSTDATESTRQIQEVWGLIEKATEPVILLGDFNSRPGSERIKWLKQRMTDTTSRVSTTYLDKPGVKIDYHFIKGDITGGTASVMGFAEGYSDHGCLINDYLVK